MTGTTQKKADRVKESVTIEVTDDTIMIGSKTDNRKSGGAGNCVFVLCHFLMCNCIFNFLHFLSFDSLQKGTNVQQLTQSISNWEWTLCKALQWQCIYELYLCSYICTEYLVLVNCNDPLHPNLRMSPPVMSAPIETKSPLSSSFQILIIKCEVRLQLNSRSFQR